MQTCKIRLTWVKSMAGLLLALCLSGAIRLNQSSQAAEVDQFKLLEQQLSEMRSLLSEANRHADSILGDEPKKQVAMKKILEEYSGKREATSGPVPATAAATPVEDDKTPLLEKECEITDPNLTSKVVMSPLSQSFAVITRDGGVSIYNASTGRLLGKMKRNAETAISMAFSADGQQLLVGTGSGKAVLWDLYSGKALNVFEKPNGASSSAWTGSNEDHKAGEASNASVSVAVSPNSLWVVAGNGKGSTGLWDAKKGTIKGQYRFSGFSPSIGYVGFTVDSRFVVIATDGHLVVVRVPVS